MRKFPGLPWLFAGLMTLSSVPAFNQGLFKVSNDEKISRSSLIIEGKVVGKRSYWNEQRTMIYTANEVEIYKVFKGNTGKKTIDIITVGGAVGNTYIHASHLLELKEDDIGVFFCENAKNNTYNVYSSSQGFLKYDLYRKRAAAPFAAYDDIDKTLYNEISSKTKQTIQIKNAGFDIRKPVSGSIISNNSELAPSIGSFSPSTVYAGALLDPGNNVLTINGSGFGTPSGQAAVIFGHADFAPGTQTETVAYNSPLIVSWNDGQIKVRVPSKAASGDFTVRHSGGTSANSPTPLNVLFSVITADNLGATYGIKQFTLGNMNGKGGYTIKYCTNTANRGININASPARETFQRALMTWKQTVGVNFIEEGTTTVQKVEPGDAENIIMFDNDGTEMGHLADGVLATCFSSVTICTDNPANNQAVKNGFDIVIRNPGVSTGNTLFTFGPCPPYSFTSPIVDLETVLLHELGHALNLGHTLDRPEGSGNGNVNPAKVMNYAVSNNQRRISLDYASVTGGKFLVTPHNYTYGSCNFKEMMPLSVSTEPKDDCPSTFPTTTTQRDSLVSFDLSLATSNRFVDPAYTQMTLDGTGKNITNTAFYPIRTNNTGGTLTIDVRNYTTKPESIEDCPVGNLGVQSTGIKMSLYKVSSCPAAGEYPTPVAYNVFTSNGSLPNITGLTANSNYLLVVDGVQNTKASFDLNFSGSALFEEETIVFSIKVVPNPVKTSPMKIVITSENADNYEFVLRNMIGQPVASYKTNVPRGTQSVFFPYSENLNGMYYLTAYNNERKKLQTVKVMIINE